MIHLPFENKNGWTESRRVAGWPIRDDIAARAAEIRDEWSPRERDNRAILLDANGRLSPERVEAMLLYLSGELSGCPQLDESECRAA